MNRSIKYKISDLNDVEKYLTTLVEECKDYSLLFIEHKNTKYFIQFAKYVMKNNNINLHFGFPDAPWSRGFFSIIQDLFKKENIEYCIVDTSAEKVPKFLEVNFIENNKTAIKIAKLTFKAMGLSAQDNYVLYFKAELDEKAIRENLKKKIEKAKAT
jgi:hypothetical protein